jgi:hypothetical protein
MMSFSPTKPEGVARHCVTCNTKEFVRVDVLKTEYWAAYRR